MRICHALFLAMLLIFSFRLSALSVEEEQQLHTSITERTGQIDLLRSQQTELQEQIHDAENQMQKLQATPEPEKTFEMRNTVVGLKYDIQQWRDNLKSLQLQINNLQRSINLDMKILQQNQGNEDISIENTPVMLDLLEDDSNEPEISTSGTDIESVRHKQQDLLKDSYRLSPGAAAVNLAKARALEPMKGEPVLGEQAVLISESGKPVLRKFVGVMEHLGGNQYYLEAILKPGLQEFVIGGYRIARMVPDEYVGVLSVVLLDLQKPDQPVLQFFVK